jgi:AcrR family transcriptional regulator
MEQPSPLRVYGGVRGDRRRADRRAQLIEAGLDVLGGTDGAKLTVRGVCQRSGLVARYFYESFADRDELAAAVYDHVVNEVAESTVAAVERAGERPSDRARAGLTAMLRLIDSDPRKGRVLFSVELTDSLIARRRRDSTRLFSRLLGEQAHGGYGPPGSLEEHLTATFVVSGMAGVLTGWLDGEVGMDEKDVIERCTELLMRLVRHPPLESQPLPGR